MISIIVFVLAIVVIAEIIANGAAVAAIKPVHDVLSLSPLFSHGTKNTTGLRMGSSRCLPPRFTMISSLMFAGAFGYNAVDVTVMLNSDKQLLRMDCDFAAADPSQPNIQPNYSLIFVPYESTNIEYMFNSTQCTCRRQPSQPYSAACITEDYRDGGQFNFNGIKTQLYYNTIVDDQRKQYIRLVVTDIGSTGYIAPLESENAMTGVGREPVLVRDSMRHFEPIVDESAFRVPGRCPAAKYCNNK